MKLRVLLVDDEKLVRKSLEALFPWAEYDMEVAGEAATGSEALAWLKKQKADIVFVDLSMPVMDGFDLLKAISLEYPAMVKIVLSCHAEIKYIQRTIEEGIAGYILKTDFEMEDIRKLLGRAREMALRSLERPLSRGLLAGCTRQEYLHAMPPGTEVIWLDKRLALIETEEKLTTLLPQVPEGIFISLTKEQLQLFAREPDKAQAVVSRQLFYEAKEDVRIYAISSLPTLCAETAQQLEEQLMEGRWLLYDDAHNTLQARIPSVYYPADRLLHALETLKEDLSYVLDSPAIEDAWEALEKAMLPRWADVQELMTFMHQAFTAHIHKTELNPESAVILLRALRIIHDPKKLFGKANEVAAMVGFSRSHFSRCFSQLMGINYRDYTQAMRLRWIERKVRQEGMSVAEIAASLNYVNAEYFCRIYHIKLTEG